MPRLRSLLALLALVPLAGCEEAVGPTLDSGAQFTLYGALDPTAGRQAIRVFPIRDRLEATAPGEIDATFTSTDLETGQQRVWRDSVVTLADGTSGNVFAADFTPEYGHTYELVAEGPRGEPTSIVVDVPPAIEPLLRSPTFGPEGAVQEVFWPGAARVNQPRVRLELQAATCERFTFVADETVVQGGVARQIEFGWVVRVPFASLAGPIGAETGTNANQLSILEAVAEAGIANLDWTPPGGVYDPEALIEPGTFSNVFNGFGFVGAGYLSAMRWQPSAEVAQRAGFRPVSFGVCDP